MFVCLLQINRVENRYVEDESDASGDDDDVSVCELHPNQGLPEGANAPPHDIEPEVYEPAKLDTVVDGEWKRKVSTAFVHHIDNSTDNYIISACRTPCYITVYVPCLFQYYSKLCSICNVASICVTQFKMHKAHPIHINKFSIRRVLENRIRSYAELNKVIKYRHHEVSRDPTNWVGHLIKCFTIIYKLIAYYYYYYSMRLDIYKRILFVLPVVYNENIAVILYNSRKLACTTSAGYALHVIR